MIKRRFYKEDRGDGRGSSDSSSSSEEEEEEVEEDELAEEEEEAEEYKALGQEMAEDALRLLSPGSGYESEDSSGNEIDGDSSGLVINEEDERTEKGGKNIKDGELISKVDAEVTEQMALNAGKEAPGPNNDAIHAELANCILKCKSVFKCRLCPRIVCLSEKTVSEHLQSKRHARSKKLLEEGRLKLMLNSDGELVEEQETHAERHARTIALAQEVDAAERKNKGRQRHQREKKLCNNSAQGKSEQLTNHAAKRRRKNAD